MKIGVMTFWWSNDNYGQILQCYALQKYLRDLGHDAYLIRYDFFSDVGKSVLKRGIKRLRNSFRKQKSLDIRGFNEFKKNRLRYSDKIYRSFNELKRKPPVADLYIVGSDQVWSCILSSLDSYKNIVKAYFLDFGNDNVKRISYAASWGTDHITDEYINFLSPLLKKFDFVSVREKSGVNLCKACDYDSAIFVPDPTFLLSKNDYIEDLINKKQSNKEKYIFLYLLKNEIDFDLETIFKWAEKRALKISYVTGNGLKDEYDKDDCSISEWLSYINDAEYVITNSFHCSVFSIIMNKQFGIIPLIGGNKGMNSRFDSLFELCDIENRYLDDNFDVLDKQYICNTDIIKKKAEEYLKKVIQ